MIAAALARIKPIIEPPVFHTLELVRAARVTAQILVAIFSASILELLLLLFLQRAEDHLLIVGLSLLGLTVSIICMILMHRGYLMLVNRVIVATACVLIVSAVWLTDGISSLLYIYHGLIILLAFVLLRLREAMIFSGIALLSALFAFLTHFNDITFVHEHSGADKFIVYTFFFILMAVIMFVAANTRMQAFREHDRAFELLTNAERRFHTLIDRSYDGIALLDVRGHVIDVTAPLSRLVGYTTTEIVSHYGSHFVHPDDRPQVVVALQKLIANPETPLTLECRFRHVNGRYIWMEVAATNLINDPVIGAIVLNCRDVNARKDAESRLQVRESMYRILSSCNQALMRETDQAALLRTIVTLMTAEKLYIGAWVDVTDTGSSPAQTWSAAAEPDDVRLTAEQRELLRSRLSLESPVSIERYPLNATESSTFSIISLPINGVGLEGALHVAAPLKNRLSEAERSLLEELADDIGFGLSARIIKFNLDRVVTALARSEDKFRAMFNYSPDAIMIVDLDSDLILQANTAVESLLGRPANKVIGQSFKDLLPTDHDRSEAFDLKGLQPSLQPSMNLSTMRMVRRDGSSVNVDVVAGIIPWEDQQAILITMRDATDRIELEAQRVRTEVLQMEMLKERELVDLKSRFVSMVSHEFRTPLSVIMSSSDILDRYSDRMDKERQREHFERIRSHAISMTGLLNDVLTLNKLQTGAAQFQPVHFDLTKFCNQLVEQVQYSRGTNHRFDVRFECETGDFYADEKLLQHVLLNLLTNAVKYSPEGSVIEFIMRCENNNLIFIVTDYGIGIPEADQAHLFQPFHRAANTGEIEGTGLGLAIVKEKVELHGGSISFTSEEGRGTTFTVRIPMVQETAEV